LPDRLALTNFPQLLCVFGTGENVLGTFTENKTANNEQPLLMEGESFSRDLSLPTQAKQPSKQAPAYKNNKQIINDII